MLLKQLIESLCPSNFFIFLLHSQHSHMNITLSLPPLAKCLGLKPSKHLIESNIEFMNMLRFLVIYPHVPRD